MKRLASMMLISLVVLSGCGGSKSKTPTAPECIRQRITDYEKSTGATPVQVDAYSFEGRQVFLFTADCCDQYNTLYDDHCNPICAPSGGLDGKGDRKCPDFAKTAKHVAMIWRKPGK